MRIELVETLSSTYSHTEVARAEQRLRDTRTDLARWQDEVRRLVALREKIYLLSATPGIDSTTQCFLEAEHDLQYNALAAAEAKTASCFRKLEEVESFLRRAKQAHRILGWDR